MKKAFLIIAILSLVVLGVSAPSYANMFIGFETPDVTTSAPGFGPETYVDGTHSVTFWPFQLTEDYCVGCGIPAYEGSQFVRNYSTVPGNWKSKIGMTSNQKMKGLSLFLIGLTPASSVDVSFFDINGVLISTSTVALSSSWAYYGFMVPTAFMSFDVAGTGSIFGMDAVTLITPEPASLALLGMGFFGAFRARRKRKISKA